MKIRLTESIDSGWHDLMEGREYDTVAELPGKPEQPEHVWVRTLTGALAHIFPGQYEVIDED